MTKPIALEEVAHGLIRLGIVPDGVIISADTTVDCLIVKKGNWGFAITRSSIDAERYLTEFKASVETLVRLDRDEPDGPKERCSASPSQS